VLVEQVLQGGFDPGAHLNADTLARELGVSHIPVREALRSMHAEGWVEFRPHSGAFVRTRTEQELADLFELRLTLEAMAAGLAAERRTSAQLEQLDLIVSTQAAQTAPRELAQVNELFHNAVAGCAHNALLADTIAKLGTRARFYYLTVAPQRRPESLTEHRQLTDAIRHRDAASAVAIARAHISRTRRDVLDMLRHASST